MVDNKCNNVDMKSLVRSYEKSNAYNRYLIYKHVAQEEKSINRDKV